MNIRRGWQQVCVTTPVVAMVMVMMMVGRAEAATRTWTGASSTEWSDPGNWGGTAPSAGDDLVFPSGAMNTNNHNDYAPDTIFASITAGGYRFSGNAIVLGAGGLTVDFGPDVIVNLAITLGASQTWRNIGLNDYIMAGPLHLNGATLRFPVTQGGQSISGTIDGVGAIDCDHCGIRLTGTNTYQGPTTIRNSGGLSADTNTALGLADGTLANGTIVENGSALYLGRDLAIGNEAISLSGQGPAFNGALLNQLGSSSIAGPIIIAPEGAKISTWAAGLTLTLSGVISGTGQLVVSGGGTLALTNGGNTYAGGFAIVGSPAPAPVIEVDADEVIRPQMQLLDLHNGTLRINGHKQTLYGLSGQGVLDMRTASPTSITALKVNGPVSLGNMTLTLGFPENFSVPIGTTFTLIDNDGIDPVSGTFVGLPEGALITTSNQLFRVSYVGGTGNDVTLTFVFSVPDYLLSEGTTNDFFTTDILLANPNTQPAPIHITFLKSDGTTRFMDLTLPAMTHYFVRVNSLFGMDHASFSTIVHSVNILPLVVERTMSWDRSGYGAHTEHATDGSSTTWYFAEGSQGFFHTYLLLANPQSTANRATVQYLREGTTPLTRSYPLLPTSRLTLDLGADAELVGQSFGMVVTFDQPGAAERAMYFGDAPLFAGGHESAGVNAPSTTWFLAEGATGPFFETFLLLANPGDIDATTTLTYLPLGGTPITATKTVAAHARLTVNLEGESPALANTAVSTRVDSTQPILVERSQYWPDPAPSWYEAHNSFGVTQLATKWGLAEGRIGNVDGTTNAQTYILIANPGRTAANVSITFLRDDGATNVTKTFVVQPTTRFNVTVGPGSPVPELTNEHFGAVVTSDQPIAVERAVYWDARGQIWSAGTNATATRLP